MHKQNKAVAMRKVAEYRRDTLSEKAIASWKAFSYRVRVQRYLEQKLKLRIGAQFLSNMREQYFQIKTERLKERRAAS